MSQIVKETVVVIYEVLQPIVLPMPSKSDWEAIEKGFWNRWNIPKCVPDG